MGDFKMRLEQYEINALKNSFNSIFKEGEIFLFGSRVDDTLRGGDIDIFINPTDKTNMRVKKIDFLVDLKSKIGDQKIDVVLAKDGTSVIEREVMEKGIRL